MPVEIDIEHVARLARLALTPEELERFRAQLTVILESAERVQEVAAQDVPATGHPVALKNVYREDQPEPSISHQDAMANAPEAEDHRFKVPRITEAQE